MGADTGFTVARATRADISDITTLAAKHRAAYERAQPLFWKVAPDAVQQHEPFLGSLVDDAEVLSLVARAGDRLHGYVFGRLVAPPPVYAPGGPSGFIDDFAVADDTQWQYVGRALLTAARDGLAELGAVQVVVVCGHHDRAKMSALLSSGLTRASEWLVGPARDETA